MATSQAVGASGTWVKSDDIVVDTTKAPWMTFAEEELGKKVHELASDDDFVKSLRLALTIDSQMQAIRQGMPGAGADSLRIGTVSGSGNGGHPSLMSKQLPNLAQQIVGQMEAASLQERNPEINKYFTGLKTDPVYDAKGRSFELAPTYASGGYGHITAWCAAFVNWCLSQAKVPHLGYATAKSWLEFGTPVAYPVHGCITIIKPSSSTGSTTGHVAFFAGFRGDRVRLLGGNQRDAVSIVSYPESNVLGYRWPTTMNHYLLATGRMLA